MPSNRNQANSFRVRAKRLALAGMLLATSGCGLMGKVAPTSGDSKVTFHDNYGIQVEYPDVKDSQTAPSIEAKSAIEPHVLEDPAKLETFDLTLQEAVQLAVQKSPVLRTIGGTIVTAPQATSTVFDPALTAASPQLGTEAALAAFDAQLTQQLLWTKTDTPNNVAQGGVTAAFTPSALQATGANYTGELSKQTAQGASFALRHVVNYNRSNQPFRAFNSDYVGWIEAEWRQPLLQGSGTEFNRIAGPTTTPGVYNGVLIARVNEDVALADFETAMITLVADVEQAYWDLVLAYRVLDAAVKGRESAQQTFQYQEVRLEVGAGRVDEEAQAKSQYYQFQAQVESALGGQQGLYAAEQRLRYLIGLAATDGRLIKPASKPTDAPVIFDWESALGQALHRRVEIRRQKFNVKRRELELKAARLNLRPRLDFLGQYRWRGLGDDLIGRSDAGAGDNLYQSITDGDFQEWQAGLEMNFPVGLRTASLAVSHAKLNLNRERAVLSESELRVSHDLSEAARQVKLAFRLLDTNYNRYLADLKQVDVLARRYRDGSDNINFLLQAQRQVVTSETDFYRSLTDYSLAIRDFHRQKGSLLAYNQVQLAEGQWAGRAAADAVHVGKYLTPYANPSDVSRPAPLTRGGFNPSAVQSSSGTFQETSQPSHHSATIDHNVPAHSLPDHDAMPSGPATIDGPVLTPAAPTIIDEVIEDIPLPPPSQLGRDLGMIAE